MTKNKTDKKTKKPTLAEALNISPEREEELEELAGNAHKDNELISGIVLDLVKGTKNPEELSFISLNMGSFLSRQKDRNKSELIKLMAMASILIDD